MRTSVLPEMIASPAVVAEPRDEVDATPVAPDHRWSDLYLDVFERFLVGGFFCWLVARLVASYVNDENLGSLLLIPSEGLVVLFMIIRRRSRAMSRQPGAWVLALGASCAVLLVAPVSDQNFVPLGVGALFLLMGTIIQVHAKITLGRSFGCVAANRGLRLVGPYRLVRHPMYAGYLVTHLAFLALNPSLWNLGVYAVCYALQIPRLLLEERLLSADPCYRDYQTQVRFRLIPGIF